MTNLQDPTANPTRDNSQRLVENHLNLAKHMAKKASARHCAAAPLHDIESDALEGLLYASRKFDATRNVPFPAYLSMVIRHRLDRTTNSIEAKRWRAMNRLPHFDDERFGSTIANERVRQPIEEASVRELLEIVRRSLPERWFLALKLRYIEGMTLTEVGLRLGIDRTNVKDMIDKAAGRVRKRLAV